MENENLDLDVKPTGNKDLWLFLIIIDIVLLCVFGFFIYTHFASDLFPSKTTSVQTAPETISSGAEPLSEELVPEDSAPKRDTPPVVEAEPEAELVVQPEEISVAQMLAEEAKKAEKEAVAQRSAPVVKEEPTSATPAKQSVIVEKNPKSKYRQVTFRWYGEGKNVAVVSGFTNRKPKALTQKGDYWEITLSIAPGTYKFLYVIDGKNRRDPYAKEQDGRSIVVVE